MASENEYDKQIGLRIRGLRLKAGLKQEELAEMTESNRANIGNYETGKASPKYDQLTKLASALRTTTDYLLGTTENPNSLANVLESNNTVLNWFRDFAKNNNLDLNDPTIFDDLNSAFDFIKRMKPK